MIKKKVFASALLCVIAVAAVFIYVTRERSTLFIAEHRDRQAHFITIPNFSGRAIETPDGYWWVSSNGIFFSGKEGKKTRAFNKIGRTIIEHATDIIAWDHALWITLQGRGILRFDPKTGASQLYERPHEETFAHDPPYTKKDGLASNANVRLMHDSFRDELWALTFKGVSRYEKANDTWVSYGDGKEELNVDGGVATADDIFFFSSGFFRFDAKEQRLEKVSLSDAIRTGTRLTERYLPDSTLANLYKEKFAHRQPSDGHFSIVSRDDIAYFESMIPPHESFRFDLVRRQFLANPNADKTINEFLDQKNSSTTEIHRLLPLPCQISNIRNDNDSLLFMEVVAYIDFESERTDRKGVYHISLEQGTMEELFNFGDLQLDPETEARWSPFFPLEQGGRIRGHPLYCDGKKMILGGVDRSPAALNFQSNRIELINLEGFSGSVDTVAALDTLFVSLLPSGERQPRVASLDPDTLQQTILKEFTPIPDALISDLSDHAIFKEGPTLHLQATDGTIFVYTHESAWPRQRSNPFEAQYNAPEKVPLLIFDASKRRWSRQDIFSSINSITVWKGTIVVDGFCLANRHCKGTKIVPSFTRMVETPVPIYVVEDVNDPFRPIFRSSGALWFGSTIYLRL